MIIGLTGKPSSGKSTFFKAATLADVEISSRPFTTLKATEGIAYVKIDCVDKEFNKQCNPKHGFCENSKRFIPIKLMDVPGLIKGSHKGKGMGNKFLDNLNEADALIHIVDISGSTDSEGNPTEIGNYDPEEDIIFLEEELNMWYFRILKKGWDKFSKKRQQEKLEVKELLSKQLSGLKVNEEMVEKTLEKLNLPDVNSWKDNEIKQLATELRKLSKPMIIAANKIDLNKDYYEKLKDKYKMIPCSAESELALKEASKHDLISYLPGENNFELKNNLNEKQKQALNLIKNLLKEFNSTGIQDILNNTIFNLLNYLAIFPVANNKLTDKNNNILPDCILLPKDSTALDSAYNIHKDFGDNFIKAIDIKTKQTIGKEHKLKHRDIIEIIAR